MPACFPSVTARKGTKTFSPSNFPLRMAATYLFSTALFLLKRNLFEKQILSIFPDARVSEKKDDYNIFSDSGNAAAAIATQSKKPIFSLKTYEKFDFDPLNILLNSFSKIKKQGEGAAIQMVFRPVGDYHLAKYKKALEKINKGEKLKDAIDVEYGFGDTAREKNSKVSSNPRRKKTSRNQSVLIPKTLWRLKTSKTKFPRRFLKSIFASSHRQEAMGRRKQYFQTSSRLSTNLKTRRAMLLRGKV